MSKKKQEINHTLEFVSYDGRYRSSKSTQNYACETA